MPCMVRTLHLMWQPNLGHDAKHIPQYITIATNDTMHSDTAS